MIEEQKAKIRVRSIAEAEVERERQQQLEREVTAKWAKVKRPLQIFGVLLSLYVLYCMIFLPPGTNWRDKWYAQGIHDPDLQRTMEDAYGKH